MKRNNMSTSNDHFCDHIVLNVWIKIKIKNENNFDAFGIQINLACDCE